MDDVVLSTMLVVLTVLFSGSEVYGTKPTLQILPEGPNTSVAVGSKLTVSCLVSGQLGSQLNYIIKLSHNGALLQRCEWGPVNVHDGIMCNATITSITSTHQGNYKCYLVYSGNVFEDVVDLVAVDPLALEMLDLSSGNAVVVISGDICVFPRGELTLECRVRDTLPGLWGITWIYRDSEIEETLTEIPSQEGLVNVSSRFTVRRGVEDIPENISCRATVLGKEFLEDSVLLQTCSPDHKQEWNLSTPTFSTTLRTTDPPTSTPRGSHTSRGSHAPVMNSTITLLDLETGEQIGTSSYTCLYKDKKRRFKCVIRDALPDARISWTVNNLPVPGDGPDLVEPGSWNRVNMTSKLEIANSDEGSLIESLGCLGYGSHGEHFNITVKLLLCPVPTIHLQDLSTGDLVDQHSPPICVRPNLMRTFECAVRQASGPNAWSIKWLLDDSTEETGIRRETALEGGLFEVTSRITVSNNGQLTRSLTCMASAQTDEALLVKVQLQDCIETRIEKTLLFVVVGVVGALLLALVTARLISCARSKRSKRNQWAPPRVKANEPPEESVGMKSLNTDDGDTVSSKSQELITYETTITPRETEDSGLPSWAEYWKIPWRDLVVDDRVLGSGNFGEVRSGTVKKDGEVRKAAVKMLKGHVARCDRDDFMDEFWTMAAIGYNPNIVLLLGACQHKDVLYVALEYLPHGDLRSYLRTARTQSDTDEGVLSPQQMISFALDVARGMEHLSKAGVIHRDLAARNILLGEGLVAKVSDFGLSRGENIYVQTSRKRVPIRWLAIESVIHHLYTTQSDVWSFGILLWEIASLGATPYSSIRNEMLIATLKRGYRMPKPDRCQDKIYTIMRDCWSDDPQDRPTFSRIVRILSEMSEDTVKETYIAVDRQRLSDVCPDLDDD